MTDTLSPAEVAIHELGALAIADYLHVAHSTVCRWTYPKPRGTGGLVPSEYHLDLLEMASKQRKRLRPAELVVGRTRPPSAR